MYFYICAGYAKRFVNFPKIYLHASSKDHNLTAKASVVHTIENIISYIHYLFNVTYDEGGIM